jgi:hypothetical protein
VAFSSYKTIGDAIKKFQITYLEDEFLTETPFPVSDYFRADITWVLREGVFEDSEAAICEGLIYPVLKEVCKSYSKDFVLWSHQTFRYDDDLSGAVDYILAKRSPLGKVVFDQPYCLLVEAKQDDFSEGWGQCLAEMIAAQKLNQASEPTIFGIVSNGKNWEFGKLEKHNLEKNTFTRHPQALAIWNLDDLCATVNAFFQQCQLQLQSC